MQTIMSDFDLEAIFAERSGRFKSFKPGEGKDQIQGDNSVSALAA